MSSTFSSYYLNQKAKDLASMITIEDRNKEMSVGEVDLEDIDQLGTIPDRRSKAGTTATRGMYTFKSEL